MPMLVYIATNYITTEWSNKVLAHTTSLTTPLFNRGACVWDLKWVVMFICIRDVEFDYVSTIIQLEFQNCSDREQCSFHFILSTNTMNFSLHSCV